MFLLVLSLFGFHGVISNDTTWSDTAYLTGDVLVTEGATLTISPGTVVLYADSCEWDTAWYADEYRTQGGMVNLIVEGEIRAIGAEMDSIYFRSIGERDRGGTMILADGADSLIYCSFLGDSLRWYQYYTSSLPHIFSYNTNTAIISCRFEYGDGIEGEESRVHLTKSEFDKVSMNPVRFERGVLRVDSCAFLNSRNLGNMCSYGGIVYAVDLDTCLVNKIMVEGAYGLYEKMSGGSAVGCYCEGCQYVEIQNSIFRGIKGGFGAQSMGGGGAGGDGCAFYLHDCNKALLSSNEIKNVGGGDGEDDNEGMGPGHGGDGFGMFLWNCGSVVIDKNQIYNIYGGHAEYYPEGDGDPKPLCCYNSSPIITKNEFNSKGRYIYIDSTSQPVIGGAPDKGNRFLNLIDKEDYVIYNGSPYDINAMYNFWQTGPDMIDSLIFDYYDDPTKGIVHYDHYTDVEERESRQQFTLSSNLVHDVLYVSFPYDSPASLEFFDAAGRRVHSEVLSGSKTEVDVSSFPRGVYFVIAQIGERQVTKKVVIR